MNIINKISTLKNEIEDLKNKRIGTEASMKILDEERKTLEKECKEFNIKPEEVEDTIKDRESSLQAEIDYIEEHIEEFKNAVGT